METKTNSGSIENVKNEEKKLNQNNSEGRPGDIRKESTQEPYGTNEVLWKLAISLSTGELTTGVIVLLGWFALFTGGIIIPTEPYRSAMVNGGGIGSILKGLVIVFPFWTISNIGILSCLASFMGALGRRARFTSRTDIPGEVDHNKPNNHGLATYYISAVMRGFGVYALVLAGLLVLATESLVSPGQETYMRLAPTVSVISFYTGYDPSILAGLLDRVKGLLNVPDKRSPR